MIKPTASFKENLALLPSIEGVARLELTSASGELLASIENQPGKQGSLAVYAYLLETYGVLNAEAAAHGVEVFAEHGPDAKARPGAHPNIDRLFEVIAGAEPMQMTLVKA